MTNIKNFSFSHKSFAGTFDGKPAQFEIAPVALDNVSEAADILIAGFPGEHDAILRSLSASLPNTLEDQAFRSKENINLLEYVMLYKNGQPIGASGLYTLNDKDGAAWMGWTAVAPTVRGGGVAKQLVLQIEMLAVEQGFNVLRAWSDARPRFNAMHRLLEEGGYARETFNGANGREYYVFSKGLNGYETTPYPSGAFMAGGTDAPVLEAEGMGQFDNAIAQLAVTRKKALGRREKSGAVVTDFIHGDTSVLQVVDLSNQVTKVPGHPLVQSFNTLMRELFPIEAERETDFPLYLTHREDGGPAHEQRVLAVVQGGAVVGLTAYGIFATTDALRTKAGIDGVCGVTYVAVSEQYRGCGLGKYIATKLVPDTAGEFLRNEGVEVPRVICGAEINYIEGLTLQNVMDDLEGAKVTLGERSAFWANCGFRPSDFDYTQLALLEGGEPLPLKYSVQGWDGDTIPSDLLWNLVERHATHCLDKGQNVACNAQILEGMREELAGKPFIDRGNFPRSPVSSDTHALASVVWALNTGRSPDESMATILADYGSYVKAGLPLHPQAGNLPRKPSQNPGGQTLES